MVVVNCQLDRIGTYLGPGPCLWQIILIVLIVVGDPHTEGDPIP